MTIDRETIPLVAAGLLMLCMWLADIARHPSPDIRPVDPTPVDPVDPDVIPAPAKGLRVLIVYESGAKLSREQLNVINSTAVRGWLNANCVKDQDGRPGWRSWDKDIDTTHEAAVWRDIWSAAKPELGDLPQVVIFRDQGGKAYPLPATEAALLDLLKGGA